MDWTMVIERNGKALRRILATLIAMAGAAGPASALWGGRQSSDYRAGGIDEALPPPGASHRPSHKGDVEAAPTLPRHRHRAILRLLRPAEAATRRLVIVAARDIPAMLQARKGERMALATPHPVKPKPTSIFVRNGKGTGIVLPRGVRPGDILPGLARPRPARRALPLVDKLPGWPRPRTFAGSTLRISVPGMSHRKPARRPPLPDDLIDATRLVLRLQAVGRVLDDLPGHARRFARWRMRAAAAADLPLRSGGGGLNGRRGRVVRIWPLRPGRPPGSRRRPTHEVHDVLADLNHFAFHALEALPPCGKGGQSP